MNNRIYELVFGFSISLAHFLEGRRGHVGLRGRAAGRWGGCGAAHRPLMEAEWFHTSSEEKKLTQDSTPRIDIHLIITNNTPRDVTVQLIQTGREREKKTTAE